MATSKTAHLKLNENRKIFIKALKNLRESGIVPKKTDLRSVKPTAHYLKLIRQNEEIAKGRAKLVEIKTQKALDILTEKGDTIVTKGKRSFLKSFFRTDTKGKVVEKHNVRVLNDGTIQRTYKKKGADNSTVIVTQKELPIKFNDIEQWMHDAMSGDYPIKDGEKIYFSLFGNYSRTIYSSVEDAFRELFKYQAFTDARQGEMTPDHIQELVRGVGIQTTKKYQTKAKYDRERITDPKKDFSRKGKRKYKRNALEEQKRNKIKQNSHDKFVDDLYKSVKNEKGKK